MSFEFDSVYLIYLFVGVSAVMAFEAFYLLFFSKASYRSEVNRRLRIAKDKPDRESMLADLRRERGLTSSGNYRLPVIGLNQLILQSGSTLGFAKLGIIVGVVAVVVFAAMMVLRGHLLEALGVTVLAAIALPYMGLRFKRAMRQRKFGGQFPDAIDVIVRSLRAGHPVPVAISMVGREMQDPVGSEFGIISDEITYGADLETALRNLYFRVGTDDLPLFVTAIAIQSSTGGNLGEILQNLSSVIRQRFKMRRKIKALAAEGRASATILSSLPIGMFIVINIVAPEFYSSVWHEELTKIMLGGAITWMSIGILIMHRMVNFRI
jgi:tight adherence protein B